MYASWLAHQIHVLTQYGKKGFGEENVIGSREQKKLQKTGNNGWLACAAVLDDSQNVSGSRERKKMQRTENSGWLVCAAVLECSLNVSGSGEQKKMQKTENSSWFFRIHNTHKVRLSPI